MSFLSHGKNGAIRASTIYGIKRKKMQAGDVFSMNDSSLTVENPDPPSILCITQDGVPIWKGSDKTLTLRMYEANTPHSILRNRDTVR